MEVRYGPVNKQNAMQMHFIAEMDSKILLSLDPDYLWTEQSINARLEYYAKSLTDTDFMEIAELDNKIVGFHMIKKIPYPPNLQAGAIITLWVDGNFRDQGIGSALKLHGETWARKEGLSHLQTAVHPSNKVMLAINEKNGFGIYQYSMRKKL